MKIKGDISGLDELEERVSDTFFSKLIEIGRDAVRFAQHNGEYKNHTFNLRNAPGFCVVKDGKIIHLEIGDDGGHPEALKTQRTFLFIPRNRKMASIWQMVCHTLLSWKQKGMMC